MKEKNMESRCQFTVKELRTIALKCGYTKMPGNATGHEKWKKSGCLDVVIPASKKEVNRMLGKRLYRQMMETIK